MLLLAEKTNYAELVNLLTVFEIMHKMMRAHNRIIPLSLDYIT